MAVYDLRGLGTDFVIHYGGDEAQIDAFTFGNSLVALGGALQAINKEVNPTFALEISVVALGGGSFRPRLRTKAKRIGALLLGEASRVVVGALATILLQRALELGAGEPRTIVQIDHVEIHSGGGDVIILPPEAYENYRKAKDQPDVDRSIRQAFEILEEDEAVTSFGFARRPDERKNLPFQIDRSRFSEVARPRTPLVSGQREVVKEREPLQIVRAIFENSGRRWQFVWNGVRISAPLMDLDFRRAVVRGEVSITHGDVFIVDLRIVQTTDESGIWVNDAYEVTVVHEHRRAPSQPDLLSR